MKYNTRERVDRLGGSDERATFDPMTLHAAVIMANLRGDLTREQQYAFARLVQAAKAMEAAGCFDSPVGEAFAQLGDAIAQMMELEHPRSEALDRYITGIILRLMGALYTGLADKINAPSLDALEALAEVNANARE